MINQDELLKQFFPTQSLSINISAYRLLFLYLVLCQSEQISFEDLNTHFLDHPLIQRNFSPDTLYNYIQTLRLFGCNITRYEEQGQIYYRLDDHPLKVDSTLPQIQSLHSICQLLSQQPLTGNYKNFYFLCKRLTRIPRSQQLESIFNLDFAIEPSLSEQALHQLEQFQKYCFEKQVLEVTYQENKNSTVRKLVEPLEVTCYKRRLYLSATDTKTRKKCRLEIERILSHRQLPNRNQFQSIRTTVTFKLTDRVALNYRAYPGESVLSKGEFLVVRHQTEEVQPLLKRLLKYGPHCEVISPTSARKEMQDMISELIYAQRHPLESKLLALINTEQTDENPHKWAYYPDTQQTSGDGAGD